VVFHGGDPARELHVIDRGRFALHVTIESGEEVMLRVLGPGEVFGEMALFDDDGSRAATVRSLERGATSAIDRRAFLALIRDEPEVAGALLELLASKVRAGDARLLEALFVPAEVRVLRRLAEVVDLYGGDGTGPVDVPLRQEDLAALAGTSRGTVNRVLRVEEERGLVELGRGRTRILDPRRLRELAG
jgi:CRP/FNR family cyclic AMP-dependent transcriptional regulator